MRRRIVVGITALWGRPLLGAVMIDKRKRKWSEFAAQRGLRVSVVSAETLTHLRLRVRFVRRLDLLQERRRRPMLGVMTMKKRKE